MSVVLGAPVPYYLELEALTTGVPRVRITVYNIPEGAVLHLRRTCAGETWTVPGAGSVPSSDTAVFTDWVAPVNRPISYTVSVDGTEWYTATVTLPSESGWLQDPIRPDNALRVYPGGRGHPDALTMASGALAAGTHAAETSQFTVMGDKYPRSFGGQRQAVTDIGFPVLSSTEQTTDALLDMIESPVLVFRPHQRLRPLPAVAYLAAEVVEEPLDQHLGGTLSRYSITGNLVAAVVQGAVTGQITYEDVQALLGEYTYGQVQEAAASTTYLDWLKDPLIFSTL